MKAKLKLDIVGACGRGASSKAACDAMGDVVIQAVCDFDTEKLNAMHEQLGAQLAYVVIINY